MGANLKGKGGIKGLLLRHGEKIAIGLVGALAFWFVYKSIQLPHLEAKYQAEELQKQISRTNTEVDSFNWDTAIKDHADKVRIFEPVAKGAGRKVNDENYALSGSLDPVVIAATALRTDPPLLNAVDVRAMGGSGLFAFMDEESRKKQDLKQKKEAAELLQQQEKEQKDQQENERAQRPGRRQARPEEAMMGAIDPNFPNRRQIESVVTRQPNIALQGYERVERSYWATVVAKVPIREQLKLYRDAFENARGFEQTRDFPQYVGYLVQRSEVIPGQPLAWKAVPLYDGQRKSLQATPLHAIAVTIDSVRKLNEAMQNWAGITLEPVDSRFVDSILTLPLPPLVGRDWGANATHPDIPLAAFAPPLEEETAVLPGQQDVPVAETEDQLTIQGTDPNQVGGGGPGYGTPAMPPGGGFREFSPGGGGRSREFNEGGASPPGGGFQMSGQRSTLPPGVNFVLLRFFDYTVEPGKKYRYRVKLLLADPNQGLVPSMLDSNVQDRLAKEAQAARAAGRAKQFFRAVENWSDPSPTVGIPLAGDVRVAEAKLPDEKLFNAEPTVTLWAETFDIDIPQDAPVHIAKEKVLKRGSVANLQEKMNYTVQNDTLRDVYDTYKLDTGYTVIDVNGANRLGKDLLAPARVLVMDPAGQLMVRNELDDSNAVQNLKLLFNEDKRRRGNEGLQPGGEFSGGRPPGRP